MTTTDRTLTFVRRALTSTAALAALMGAGVLARAQQPVAADTTRATTLNLAVPASDMSESMFSSSSANNNEVAVAEHGFNFVDATNAQPGQRRYGRPRYRGSNTNPDGSNKYTFFAGAGLSQPVGDTYHYNTPSYAFQVGVGRNFNQNFGVNVQFDWDRMGLNGRTLATATYAFTGGQDGNAADYGIDGSTHVWSFSIDPQYNIAVREGLGAYLIGGVGFYHKNTTFTAPQEGTYCDYYYGCYTYTANSSFDGGTYNSNAPGFNGGFGLTFKPSRFSNEKLYGEIRYVVTLNSQRYGVTAATAATYTGNNYYPANSNRTTYLPIKFGVRF